MGPFEHGDGYDEICGIENHTQSAFGAHNFTITWGLLLGTQHIPQILAWIHRCEADGCCHALGWWPTLPQLVTIRVSQKAKKLEVWISCTMNIAENRHILNDDILITNFLLVTSHKKRNYCFFLVSACTSTPFKTRYSKSSNSYNCIDSEFLDRWN